MQACLWATNTLATWLSCASVQVAHTRDQQVEDGLTFCPRVGQASGDGTFGA